MNKSKMARVALGLTQREIAKRLDVTVACVSNWEKNGYTERAAQDMEGCFGIRASWLLTGEGEMFTDAVANNQRLTAQNDGAITLLRSIVNCLTISQCKAVREIIDERLK